MKMRKGKYRFKKKTDYNRLINLAITHPVETIIKSHLTLFKKRSVILLFDSLGQTPVFQKDLTGKYLFAIILLELLIYLLDLGGLSLWIRKLLIMSRQAVKIH